MSVELQKAFRTITKEVPFDLTAHLAMGELSSSQRKHVDKVKALLEGNRVGDAQVFGGKLDEAAFQEYEAALAKALEHPDHADVKDKLEKPLKSWKTALKKQVEEVVMAVFPVKDMPFEALTFRTVPKVEDPKDQLKFSVDTTIAVICEIKCIVNRTTLYGEMKDEDPLFAPLIGEMDLGDFKLTDDMKGPLGENFAYHTALLASMDSRSTRNNVTRYHAQYDRHGEPICDFFMHDDQLMAAMNLVTTGTGSKRISSGAAVNALVKPHRARSIVIVHEEKKNYEAAIGALLNLAAACFDSPQVRKTDHISDAEAMTAAAPPVPSGPGVGGLVTPSTPGGGPSPSTTGASPKPPAGGTAPAGTSGVAQKPAGTPAPAPGGAPGATPARPPGGAPNLPVWTAEELAEEVKKRGTPAPNLPVWTEEDLAAEAKKRGLPAGLEYWTEEDLEKERHGAGGLDIPEWEDTDLPECPECGAAVRPGWDECPICGAALEGALAQAEKPPAEAPAKPPAEAPAKPPAQAPAKPPAQAPAKPPAQAPAKPPTKGPAGTPTPAQPATTPEKPGAAEKPTKTPAKPP